MKKILFLLTVLVCLVLSSGVLAEEIPNHYCLVDDYGCYVMDEENHSSYLMFWSEAGRRAVMGELTAPYEKVVDKPGQDAVVNRNLLPLLAPLGSGETEDSAAAVCDKAQFTKTFCNVYWPGESTCSTDLAWRLKWKKEKDPLTGTNWCHCYEIADSIIQTYCEHPENYQTPDDLNTLLNNMQCQPCTA